MRVSFLYLLVALLFIGCERNNATLTGSIDSEEPMAASFKSMSNPEPYSDSFEFEFSLSYDELEFEGTNPDGLNFGFETTSNNVFNLSSPIMINPSYSPANPGDFEYDVVARVSQSIPTNISVNGSTIYYSGESSSLNSQENSIMNWAQDGLDDALTDLQNYSGGCAIFPCPNKAVSSKMKSPKNSLQSMSKEEVIEHLESQGFDVEQVRGWEFLVSRTHKDIRSQEAALSTTYIYNVKTGEISLNEKNRPNGLAVALSKAEKLGDKNPRIQSLISRTEKEGLVKSLRMSSNRKTDN